MATDDAIIKEALMYYRSMNNSSQLTKDYIYDGIDLLALLEVFVEAFELDIYELLDGVVDNQIVEDSPVAETIDEHIECVKILIDTLEKMKNTMMLIKHQAL